MNALTINNHELGVKEFNKQRVVTFKDVDLVHERPNGTASRNFRTNRKYFIPGEDYFLVKPQDIQNDEIRRSEINPRGTTLLTETGYLMLVKSFTDDLAWDVQRKLVKSYFRAKQEVQQAVPLPAPTATAPMSIETVTPKTYKGDLVLTVNDLSNILGISKININYNLRHSYLFVKGVDYRFLKDADLVDFKNENRGQFFNANTLNVIYPSGAEKMMRYSPDNSPAMLDRLDQYFKPDTNHLECESTPTPHNMGMVFEFMEYLASKQQSSPNMEKIRDYSARIELLRQYVIIKKQEMTSETSNKSKLACEAVGAIQYSSIIGDISKEKASAMIKGIHNHAISIGCVEKQLNH